MRDGMKIAITGGIGAGKSTLVEALRRTFPTALFVSMDAFVDALYQDPEWLDWLDTKFGTRDRKTISQRAFADPAILAQLNAQSALKIGVSLGRLLERPALTFLEFPLLLESGLAGEFDRTVLITAQRDVRIQRVVARGRKTAEQAAAVLDAQMPEDRKRTLVDAVIDTSLPDSQDACARALVDTIERFLTGSTP